MKFYSSITATPESFYSNRGLAYGDGVFETMFCHNQKIPLLKYHWQRLEQGLDRLKLGQLSQSLFTEKTMALIGNSEKYIIKLTVIRKGISRGYLSISNENDFTISVLPYHPKPTINRLTLSPVILSQQKNLAGLKHLSRLEQVLASQQLIGCDYQDALMLDNKGNVIETINKNIIFIKGQKIYSPKLNKSGVYGVALRWLEAFGYQIKWKNINLKNINKYHAMAVCNSIIGFQNIINVDNKVKYKKNNKLLNEISKKWQETMGL